MNGIGKWLLAGRINILLLGILVTCTCTATAVGGDDEAPGEWVERIGLLGCLRQYEPIPALHKYLEMEPDICLWLGDNIYADAMSDESIIIEAYQALEARPEFRKLRDQSTFVAGWDDHDYGDNNEGKNYKLKYFSKEYFRNFWRMQSVIPAERDGIYHVRRFPGGGSGLQIIVLDPRYNRDDEGPEGDTLGEAQWEWLELQLKEPASLRLLVSGYQILLGADVSSETWSKFPKSKNRLMEVIRRTGTENLIIITGDQHYAEVLKVPDLLDMDAYEIQFSGLNQIEASHLIPFRQTPTIRSKHTYAMLDIEWNETDVDVAHVVYRVIDAQTDIPEIIYRINFSDLQLTLNYPESGEFYERMKFGVSHNYRNLELRYATGGELPVRDSPILSQPIEIHETTEFKMALFTKDGFQRSPVYTSIQRKASLIGGFKITGAESGLVYQYWEGEFESATEARQFRRKKSGIAGKIDIKSIAEVEDHYAIEYVGFIEIPEPEVYTFELLSDDGSVLTIHETVVVDNDGSHSERMRRGAIPLDRGYHPVRISYFEDFMGQKLKLRMFRPDGAEVPLKFFHLGEGR